MLTRRNAVGVSLAVLASDFALLKGVAAANNDLAANKELVQRYITEVINDGNLDALDVLVAEDYTSDDPDHATGRDALRERLVSQQQVAHTLVDDLTYTIAQITAESDRVVVRGFITGTSNGEKVNLLYFAEVVIRDNRIAASCFLNESLWGL